MTRHPTARTWRRRTAVALVLGTVGAMGGAATPVAAPITPAAHAQGADGPCTDPAGVTVIVDFQSLGGGGPQVRCASGSPGTGFEALRQAGVGYQTALRSPGFLCRIAGLPANDPCVNPSPAHAYWSYWLAHRGGTWCYSNWGAGNRTPPPGSVEGWSFAQGGTAHPPRIAPPPPAPGAAPVGLPAGDCGSQTPAPPTTPPPTTPPAPPPTNPPPPATHGAGSPADGPSGPAEHPAKPDAHARSDAPGAPGASPDGPAHPDTAPEGPDAATPEPDPDDAPAEATDATSGRRPGEGDERAAPAAAIDLRGPDAGPGSPAGTIATGGLVLGTLGLIGWHRSRRREPMTDLDRGMEQGT